MKSQKTILRYLSFTPLLFLICVFFLVRDIRFISIINGNSNLSREFSEVAGLCVDFPNCFRLLPSVFGEMLYLVMSKTTELFSINPDPFSSNPTSLEDRLIAANSLASISFRMLSIIFLWILVNSFIKNLMFTNVILTTYFFLLTAPHAKSLSEVVSKFTDDNRIINWTQNMPSMYVVYYDYSAIPLVIFIIMYIEKFERMKKIHLFFCGLLLFLTFDYLPIIAFLILLFRNGIRTFFDYLMLLVSGICFTFFALFYNRKSDLESTFSYYFVNNFSQFFGVLVLIPMILLPHWILGRLVSHWMPNSMASLVQNDPLFRTKLNHGLISLFIVHLMSLFTSNFIGEFGRQSLALQLLITIIAILKKPALNNRGVALQDF